MTNDYEVQGAAIATILISGALAVSVIKRTYQLTYFGQLQCFETF
jgi:hypothetical protein